MSDGSPRVVHVISGIDVGGAENHLLRLAAGQVDAGYDVTIAYLKGDGELAEAFRDAGCRVERIGIRADADPIGFARLVRHLSGKHYDLLHGHLFHGNVYGVAAATLGGVEHVVCSKHNDPPFWDRQPYRTIHDLTLRRAERVLPISDHVRSYLLETTRVDPSIVRTVRYGLDPAPFDAVDETTVAATRAEFADPDQSLVGTVARLTEQKDLPTLLEAFAAVHSEHPDARLVLVGRGEQESRLRSTVADLGISDAVTFAGFREDIPALMRAFDCFALTSRWEGFGLVFLEAMAASTPVVASDASAIPEIVSDGETGYLVEPGDVEGFAHAIGDLLSNPNRAASFGSAGHDRLEAAFTEERMVEEVIDVYESLGVP